MMRIIARRSGYSAALLLAGTAALAAPAAAPAPAALPGVLLPCDRHPQSRKRHHHATAHGGRPELPGQLRLAEGHPWLPELA